MTTRVVVIGAGAIGGVLAWAASRAGHDVEVCVRRPIDGLDVESGGEVHPVPVKVRTDPAEVGPAAWVLLTTKVFDTASTAPWLARSCTPDTVVVAAQNGVGHVERVGAYMPAGRVLPALAYLAAERTGPGRVVFHSGRRLVVPAGPDGAAFADLLRPDVLDVRQVDDFTTAVWRKLLGNVAANPITALTTRRIDVMADPGVEDLSRRLMGECVRVAQAAGAALDEGDVDRAVRGLELYRTNGSSGSSMLYDRLAGLPLEHEELNGVVVAEGARLGVPTPDNTLILTLLRALDAGRGRT
ncbi:MAG: 2-dehydropantoate 2-reductase [Actinomycetes bacterium]